MEINDRQDDKEERDKLHESPEISQRAHQGTSKVGNTKLGKMCWDVSSYLDTIIHEYN